MGTKEVGNVIPHSDGAGIVVSTGPGVDTDQWLERPVWVFHAQRGRSEGTAAQYVALPERLCRPAIGGYTLREVAAIGIPMMTAHAALFSLTNLVGRTVLVTGAGGAVGHYVLQWARWAGAGKLIAVTRSALECERALASGADLAIDCLAEPAAPQLRRHGIAPGSVDMVADVDIASTAGWIPQFLAPHCRWSAFASSNLTLTVPFRNLLQTNATLRFVQSHSLSANEVRAALDDIDRIHDARRITHRATEVFPLQKIAEAHMRVEQGSQGRAVLLSVEDHK